MYRQCEAHGATLHIIAADQVPDLTARVYDNLVRLIDAFDRPDTPYLSTPEPEWPLAFPEYDHLARLREWSGGRRNGS